MPYTYEYPRPAVTVDCLIHRITGNRKEILLVRRNNEPFKGMWALPGGFVRMNETLVRAARRELNEETGLEIGSLEQFHTFDKVDRDPRHRTISIVFTGRIEQDVVKITAGSDAGDVNWFPLAQLPELAFDHDEIIRLAMVRNAI
jgi:8-oxo-dGTP diphosphatase